MIDWNVEIQKSIVKKQEDDLLKQQKLQEKERQDAEAKEKYLANNKIFDDIFEEERTGIEALLKSTGHEYQMVINSGSVEFRKVDRHDGFRGWGSKGFGLEIKEGTDLSIYTRERLASFITWILLYWDKGEI